MARFNTSAAQARKTTNLAGGDAYVMDPKFELVSVLLTSFVKDQFYRSAGDTMEKVKELIDKISDKKFVAKSAIYARDKFHMRSITHVAAGELAKRVKGEQWTKQFYANVVQRPDDVTEIMSYYGHNFGKPFPNSLKKGMALALQKFDEYQIGKYKGSGKSISLIDAINLVRPKPTKAIDLLVKGKLRAPETWEKKLTQAGQKAKNDEEKEDLKNKAWKDLVLENKIGYFALLRNLRNILEQSPEIVGQVCRILTSEKRIKKSKVLPFRFLTASEEIQKTTFEGSRKVLEALAKAADIALQNVPAFPGKTLIALDISGSMEGRPIAIGSLFAAALYKANDAMLMLFKDDARYKTINPALPVSAIQSEIMRGVSYGGTNFDAIFQEANAPYDRIIILSDMQAWMGGYGTPDKAFKDYKKRTGATPNIFHFDLAGYGSMQFPQNNVYEIAGFSDKAFDIMAMLEKDRKALIKEIEAIKL